MNQQTGKVREQFNEAAYFWKLDALYADLAAIKGTALSKTEKLHLHGLLCGCGPTEIAGKLYKSVRGTESDLCSTIYQYVKVLVGKENQKVGNWRNISEWLQKSEYKIAIEPEEPNEDTNKKSIKIPIDKLNGLIRIDQINSNDRSVVFEINIRVVAAMPTEEEKTDTDKEE